MFLFLYWNKTRVNIPVKYTNNKCDHSHLKTYLAYKTDVCPRPQSVAVDLLLYPVQRNYYLFIVIILHIIALFLQSSEIRKFNKFIIRHYSEEKAVLCILAYLIIIASFSIGSILQMSLIVINIKSRSQSIEQIFGWKWMKCLGLAFLRQYWKQYASHCIYIKWSKLKQFTISSRSAYTKMKLQ